MCAASLTVHKNSSLTLSPLLYVSLSPPPSIQVIDHYEHPRNVGSLNKSDPFVGTGLVGAPACGDVMKLQIKVDEASGKIVDVKFKTFGCGSAIASSSYMTERVRGMSLEDAGAIKNTDVAKELCLPPVKLHCSSTFISFPGYICATRAFFFSLFFFSFSFLSLLWRPCVLTLDISCRIFIIVLAEDAIKSAINDYKRKRAAAAASA